jgi:transposase InsO family protein
MSPHPSVFSGNRKPFQIVSVNFLTDLPPLKAIMIVVDRFSKRIYTAPCNKTINSEGTARLFKDVAWRYEGLPETVISDHGPQFVSEFTRELYKLLGIKQNLSTAAHAQTDGQTERVNQEIEQYFRIFIQVNAQMNDWAVWLPIAEHCYNNRVHSETTQLPESPLSSPLISNPWAIYRTLWQCYIDAIEIHSSP